MIAPMNFANAKYWPNRYLPNIAGQIVRSKDDGTRFLLPNAKVTGFNLLFRLAERHTRVWPDLEIPLAGIERPCRARCGR